jgi:hypothetical protein
MESLGFIATLVALGLVWHLSTKREGFVAEFIEQSDYKRTLETSKSSYRQETNHYAYLHNKLPPVPGVETPFRVNIWNSYQPV